MANNMEVGTPNIEKIGCKEDGEKANRCDIEVIFKVGSNSKNVRMVKRSEGWSITNLAYRWISSVYGSHDAVLGTKRQGKKFMPIETGSQSSCSQISLRRMNQGVNGGS